jgi:hypothetical protein
MPTRAFGDVTPCGRPNAVDRGKHAGMPPARRSGNLRVRPATVLYPA